MLTGHLSSKARNMDAVKEVQLSFDFSTLSTLVNFAYGGGLDICGESVASLLAAADFLRMEEGVTVCCQWLLKNISVENVFMVRDMALEYRQIDLLENVDRFLKENFEAVSHLLVSCSACNHHLPPAPQRVLDHLK